jgi:hypothetical protein
VDACIGHLVHRDDDADQVFRTTRPGILLFRSGAGTIGMILAFHA